jgi:hypothetical protein
LQVFLYAIKHDYDDLADKAAPCLVHTPLENFLDHATQAGLSASAVVHFVSHIF